MNIFKRTFYRLKLKYLMYKIKNIKKQFNFIGSRQRPHKNHRLFGVDENGLVYEVPTINKKKVFINDNHRFMWALNMKSVQRKLKKAIDK